MRATRQGSVEPLLQFRSEAEKKRNWECVRDADLLTLKMQFDKRTFDHLVFGTSLPAYRTRIREQLPYEPSESFIWGEESESFLELKTGRVVRASSRGGSLNAGKKVHQVIMALAMDFYAPRRIGVLYADLYPDEFFDVDTSPLRVRQLLKRTRQWFVENHIPIAIEHMSGTYRLVFRAGFGIKMELDRRASGSDELRLNELWDSFPNGVDFTVRDACVRLGLSRSSFHRLIEGPLQTGQIVKSGTGKATVYRLAAVSEGPRGKRVA